MNEVKTDAHSQTFGVSKPVGSVVASFRTQEELENASRRLEASGFSAEHQVRFSPEEMVRQADVDIAQASPLASLGQELNLVKAHRALAAQGQWFLTVKARSDEQTEAVGEIMRDCHATRAQKYGAFLIEELVDVGTDDRQVAESPDRGLDAQNATNLEGDR